VCIRCNRECWGICVDEHGVCQGCTNNNLDDIEV
jgi:hypothetical protein